MIVTIIGSLQNAKEIKKAKDFFIETIDNCKVYTPIDEQTKPLTIIQKEYLEKITKADLIVLIPKNIMYVPYDEGCKNIFTYGESTSYELAISEYLLNKKVMIWYGSTNKEEVF